MAGKNKKNNKGGFQNQQNNGQKSKADMVEELKQAKKEKIDAALITDERVAAKIEELEKTKKDLETEYKEKEKALQDGIDEKELALEERKEKLDELEKKQQEKARELENTEAQVKKQREAAAAEEIARIRSDERSIREAEKETVYKEWEADQSKKSKDLEEYIANQREKIDAELEKAHNDRMEAEEKKLERIHEADKTIEAKRAELTKEYEDKMSEYISKKHEYEKELQKLNEERANFEEDYKYVKELKDKYNQYSEAEVIKLREQIAHHEARIKSDDEIIKDYRDKNTHMESILLDDDGRSLVVKIRELEDQLKDARKRSDELANMPSVEEIERLRAKEKELEKVNIALDNEKQKRSEAEAKISAYAMSTRELENARVAAAALESLNNQLQMKLKYISEQYKTTQESKFKVLLDIDKDIANQKFINFGGSGGKSLEDLCKYVRDYGAKKEGLYYSLETIQVFFASLAASDKASRLIILQGLSGTGKSSLPRLVAQALGAECKRVSVQPSWRDNRELLGYDNDFTNRFKETEFTKYLYEASALPNRKKLYIILLDEMNLARIEYYFADFLSVLEETNKSKWIVPLVSGYSELDEDQKPKYLDYSNEAANICITDNIWFVGTANNDDSTSLITDKVYDRAQVLDMDVRESKFVVNGQPKQISMDIDELTGLFNTAKQNNQFNEEDHDRIKQVDVYLKDMDITFGNRIVSQMEDFVPVFIACGGDKNKAIDYILTHKILRKLDERYEPYLVNKLEELEQGLNDIYGEGVFKQSIDKIKKLRNKIQG